MTFKIEVSQFYEKSDSKKWKWNKIIYFFMGHIQIWHHIIFYQKILKYFNDFQNRNFSVLCLEWTQPIEMKQNQTFSHGTYSNVTPYLSLSKNIKIFQWLSKSKFVSFMTKVDQNIGIGAKSDFFSWDIFKSDSIFYWSYNSEIFTWLLQLALFNLIVKVNTTK